MTDIVDLAMRLRSRIEWQNVPEDITQDDMTEMIANGIRHLYVMTGRSLMFSDRMFIMDNEGMYLTFSETLQLDEEEYVLVTAELEFYRKVQTSVSDQTSYTTDAMSVSHGDKPFANLQQKIGDQTSDQRRIWYKMCRYHLL